jgi:hypothetical protein
MANTVLELAHATLTRVGYVDVPIPPELAGLAAADFAGIDWRAPLWAEGEQLRAGAAAWFAEIGGERVAFDPMQAADGVLRADRGAEAAHQAAIAKLFAEAGCARESVDALVMTHIEGVGMAAWRRADGRFEPFFPNAAIRVSAAALDSFLAADSFHQDPLERDAWSALIAAGVVRAYADGESLVPGLRAEVTGAHCPGHAVLHFAEPGRGAVAATMLGHLAVSPLHLATGECPQQHYEPARAWSALRAMADDGRFLIGPLWPTPGYGRWLDGRLVAGA